MSVKFIQKAGKECANLCSFNYTFNFDQILYHRERIYFSSTLSCNKKEEKNHHTSHFERVRPFQSTKQLWARAPISINQATLSTCAHFNQPSNFEGVRPFQSTKQL
jgi:hypothetical protein